eukprot:TRINITY_DN11254_c0_g1_i2.p2 TRINITY_DN11254_c0_g1~~TRINITY_DN11254_c0_g1_i2.p2  ORF type:complete len:323 (-),score=48.85 TRINITY_DN11254_c0_g1_i2:185-1153(-)
MKQQLLNSILSSSSAAQDVYKRQLHYNNGQIFSQYYKAIDSVGQILINYDYDKLIPCYGFGGKPQFPQYKSDTVSHCFSLNGNETNPDCFQVKGILDAYLYAINHVNLSGPTLFSPMFQKAMEISKNHKASGEDKYVILLILTDGEIHDMDQALRNIVDSWDLPLSIIIVGVGNEQFEKMETLDGDEGLWDSSGRKAKRDLVQFVPFNKFNGNPDVLAENVLQELPTQLCQYMGFIEKLPNVPDKIQLERFNTEGYYRTQTEFVQYNQQQQQQQYENQVPLQSQQFANQLAQGQFLQGTMYNQPSQYQVNPQQLQSNFNEFK